MLLVIHTWTSYFNHPGNRAYSAAMLASNSLGAAETFIFLFLLFSWQQSDRAQKCTKTKLRHQFCLDLTYMYQDVKKNYGNVGVNMDVDVCVNVNVYHQVM